MPVSRALSVDELMQLPLVKDALEAAWKDSLADDPARRHEEGGWVYQHAADGPIAIRRAPAGEWSSVDLGSPPVIRGWFVVCTFHTHPHPSAEGWYTGPSEADTDSAHRFGVPCIIRADDGIHLTGPRSRRGGLAGSPAYPR